MLRFSSASANVDVVAEGFDLAIRPRPTEDSGMMIRLLGDVRLVTVASPDYLAKHGTPKAPDDLAEHRLVLHSARVPRSVMSSLSAAATSASRVVSNDAHFLMAMALAGVGITTLPVALAADALAAGDLVNVLPDHAQADVKMCALWPQGAHLSPVVRALVDRLTRDWPDSAR